MLCGVVGCVVLVKRVGGGLGGVRCWVWLEVHCVVGLGVSIFLSNFHFCYPLTLILFNI